MSDADVLGAGTGAGVTGSTFRPEPAAFVPGAQWVNLVSGSLSVSSAIAVPNATYLAPGIANDGITGPQDGAVIFLAGTETMHDGGQRALLWDANSVLAADGVTVFNPWFVTGTPGRWRRLGGSNITTVPQSAAVSLTSTVFASVVSAAVGPGELDAYGTLYLIGSAAGIIDAASAFITTTGIVDLTTGLPGMSRVSFAPGGTAIREVLNVGPIPIISAVPIVVTLMAQAVFGSGIVSAYGSVFLRRPM